MQHIPYRIRLGVTGHRTLNNESQLKEKVKHILETEIFKLFDEGSLELIKRTSVTPIAFSIYTALAEGADRLVAEEVLNFDEFSTIEVVLPLTEKDYRKTFINSEDNQFEELFSKARRPVYLRKYDMEIDPEIIQNPEGIKSEDKIKESRHKAYKSAGEYVVDHCDVLIAIWDGKESKRKGGTKNIIDYAKKVKRPIIIISANPPNDISIIRGNGLNAEAIQYIEQFNTIEVLEGKQNSKIDEKYEQLFDNPEGKSISSTAKSMIKKHIIPFYLKASENAKKNKKKYKPAGNLIIVCSLIAVVSVLAGILYNPILFYSFIAEFICLLTIFFVYKYIKNIHADRHWLENRFLAERLRSAWFFISSNMEISRIVVPPYMGHAHKQSDWMIKVFEEIWNRLPKLPGPIPQLLPEYKNFIGKYWVDNQKYHHFLKSKKLKKENTFWMNLGWTIFAIALIAAFLHIMEHLFHIMHIVIKNETAIVTIEKILAGLAIILPAIGAAIVGIRTYNETERIESRSHNMAHILENFQTRFLMADSITEFESLMYETDELILRENQEWFMLMKFVKLEVLP
ncbi:MAG: hypothetical protein K8S16_07165 [Bacteroidales bacterium]|nr:hypothetical protein [Bacteroidales bacterium]